MCNSTVRPSLDSSLIPDWPTAPQILSGPMCNTTRRCSSSRLNGPFRSRCTGDYPYFPHENHTMIAATIHFDDAPIEKECIRVVPGSFKNGPYDHTHKAGSHLPTGQYPVEEAPPVPPKQRMCCSSVTSSSTDQDSIQATNPARRCWSKCAIPRTSQWAAQHLSRGQGMMLRGIEPGADADSHVGPSRDIYRSCVRNNGGLNGGQYLGVVCRLVWWRLL